MGREHKAQALGIIGEIAGHIAGLGVRRLSRDAATAQALAEMDDLSTVGAATGVASGQPARLAEPISFRSFQLVDWQSWAAFAFSRSSCTALPCCSSSKCCSIET
jgi:hypothetical protein